MNKVAEKRSNKHVLEKRWSQRKSSKLVFLSVNSICDYIGRFSIHRSPVGYILYLTVTDFRRSSI